MIVSNSTRKEETKKLLDPIADLFVKDNRSTNAQKLHGTNELK
jgi:hypothetical protein